MVEDESVQAAIVRAAVAAITRNERTLQLSPQNTERTSKRLLRPMVLVPMVFVPMVLVIGMAVAALGSATANAQALINARERHNRHSALIPGAGRDTVSACGS